MAVVLKSEQQDHGLANTIGMMECFGQTQTKEKSSMIEDQENIEMC
jgi:hypothetical protein